MVVILKCFFLCKKKSRLKPTLKKANVSLWIAKKSKCVSNRAFLLLFFHLFGIKPDGQTDAEHRPCRNVEAEPPSTNPRWVPRPNRYWSCNSRGRYVPRGNKLLSFTIKTVYLLPSRSFFKLFRKSQITIDFSCSTKCGIFFSGRLTFFL